MYLFSCYHLIQNLLLLRKMRVFLGGPRLRWLRIHLPIQGTWVPWNMGSIPSQGTKISHALGQLRPGEVKNKYILKKKKKGRMMNCFFFWLGGEQSHKRERIPIWYSCLENSMDRGTWWVTVHGAAKSQTQLSIQHFYFFT